MITLLVVSHSLPPAPGYDTFHDSHSGRGCTVRLLKRENSMCWPLHTNRPGGYFSCLDKATVLVQGRCTGLFQCGNGATTTCGQLNAHEAVQSCNCTASVSGVDPSPPAPPAPPPHPRHPATPAGCASFCAALAMKPENAHWCKCAACPFNKAHRHAQGAPCLGGHVMAHAHKNCSQACATEYEKCVALGSGLLSCGAQLRAGEGPLMEAGCEPGCTMASSTTATTQSVSVIEELLNGLDF